MRKFLVQVLDFALGTPAHVEVPRGPEIPFCRLALVGRNQMSRRQLVSHRFIAMKFIRVSSFQRLLVQSQGQPDTTVQAGQLGLHEQLKM